MSPKNPEKITITHVAKAAGVAVGTVSRVLNDFGDVNRDARERVMAAVRKLNYTRLRQRKSTPTCRGRDIDIARNIAVVCIGMEDAPAQLPALSTALREIKSVIAARGGTLTFANIPKADRVPAFLKDGRVDGVIIKGPDITRLPPVAKAPLLAQLNRIPRVWLMGRPENALGDHCSFDTDEAGRLAAQHFADKGHRRLAFLNPKPGQDQFERLKRAFMFHGARLGATMNLIENESPANATAWPLPAGTSPKKVAALIARWAAQPPSRRATGIFTPSDHSAVQACAALNARGKHVGVDVSLISCNNEESLIADLKPRLTTIDVHASGIGARTVGLLLWRIAHKDEPVFMQMLLQPRLVERDSVATIK